VSLIQWIFYGWGCFCLLLRIPYFNETEGLSLLYGRFMYVLFLAMTTLDIFKFADSPWKKEGHRDIETKCQRRGIKESVSTSHYSRSF
jgi:hypothetical protein